MERDSGRSGQWPRAGPRVVGGPPPGPTAQILLRLDSGQWGLTAGAVQVVASSIGEFSCRFLAAELRLEAVMADNKSRNITG